MSRRTLLPGEEELQRQIGAQLREVRKAATGLSLKQVEEATDGLYSGELIATYERGDRAVSAARLYRLAEFYGRPIESMYPGQDADVVFLSSLDQVTDYLIDTAATLRRRRAGSS